MAASAAVAAAQRVAVVHKRQRQSNCSSVDAAAGEARWWCAPRRWQRGCSSVDATAVAAARQRNVDGSLAAAQRQLQRQWRWWQRNNATLALGAALRKLSGAAVAAARSVAAVHSAMAAVQLQQLGGRLAAARRQRQRQQQRDIATLLAARRRCGRGCSVGGATKVRQWRTAQRRQRGGSSAEAAADSPAPSVNGPTHAPSNTTNLPTYASSSLVECSAHHINV